ncbi:site-specific integrase [Roseivivax sp. THAF197b]|uniref:site-specific integrase n=1 Tax=Roseivivax sp. THAF197b TaxID=2588299 RepID=UPI00126942BC|nr:site-specific integrase [Roseivivax sp. THAF197b]QFS83022.1 site-specific tyrosine recombinase XerC [Roseivivax sp. THAF197b]
MALDTLLQSYLDSSGESMRALSLRAGLNPKAVSDILNIPGLKPRHATLAALSEATGHDLFAAVGEMRVTYADLIAQALKTGNRALASKLRWLCRKAGWTPELRAVCKQDVIDFFDANTAARFGLTEGSFATYRSALIKAAGRGEPRQRKRRIDDITGIYRDVQQAIKNSALPKSARLSAGSFLLFLHDADIAPGEITTATLGDYYNHRIAVSPKSEAQCEKHVREIATLLKRLANAPDFSDFGFVAATHPFADARNRYGVADETIAPLMAEFDARVAPWVLGELSRDGKTREAFIAELDARHYEEPIADKKALLRAKRREKAQRSGQPEQDCGSARNDAIRKAGFLVGKGKWSEETLRTRRGYVVSIAKALSASTSIVPDTVEELTDPEFLEAAMQTLKEANQGEFPSSYLSTVLKAIRKIAQDYQCRSAEDLLLIDDLIKLHKAGFKGISPRNKAKLRQFNDARIKNTINLSGEILKDVNRTIDQRRTAWKKRHGMLPKPVEVVDAELARDIMAALAHDILLSRAPRSANVLQARLDWINWQDDRARIVVPASKVKMREAGDADLTIVLARSTSRLLQTYLHTVRPKLVKDQQDTNPYLFPGQGATTQDGHYGALLERVTRILHSKVGVKIHPHLYRHLVGWIWLKESLDNLPKVQKLLGHKRIETTIEFYAELDENLISDEWLAVLDRRKAA